jgi:hypothetical protein
MNPTTTKLTVAALITIALGFAVAYNAPAPWLLKDEIPGWFFWGIGFVIELGHIALIGRPEPDETDPVSLLKFDLGMSEDE